MARITIINHGPGDVVLLSPTSEEVCISSNGSSDIELLEDNNKAVILLVTPPTQPKVEG